MSYEHIICLMKEKGVSFENGLTETELEQIEKVYDISFPASLLRFYKEALPVGVSFVKWNDFSEENIANIKEKMYLPYKWLSQDITYCEAFRNAKNAPKLIPIYSHRYMPIINHTDPPVFSTVGADTIWYGKNLEDYLFNEFIREYIIVSSDIQFVPLWSNIINNNV